MSHDTFLLTMAQLASKKKARVVIQGSVVFIETLPENKKWKISTKVFSCDGYLSPSLRECLKSTKTLRWQERGAYLQLDEENHSVHLVHEIISSSKYVPFKYLMNDFAQVANEWREILDEFARRDHIPIRLEKN